MTYVNEICKCGLQKLYMSTNTDMKHATKRKKIHGTFEKLIVQRYDM